MTYKVLNNDGDRIVVDTINPQIHKHLSWRDFNENDACVTSKVTRVETINIAKDWIIEEGETKEMTREQAIEAYKEKYGRKPSSQMKTENIIAKL